MSVLNTAAILRGPAIVNWRGFTTFHRDKLEIPTELTLFEIGVEPYGVVQSRADTGKLPINIMPAGRTTEVENLINRYANSRNGDLLNIEEYPVTLNASTNLITCTENHLLADGDEVMLHWLVSAPGGVSRTTRYYARVTGNSATTLTIYDNAAHAIAGGGTGLIDITTVGSGVVLDVTRALTITTLTGLQIKYYNVGLTKIPDLEFSAVKPMLGQAEFMAFIRNGQDPEDPAERFYEISAVTPPSLSFDPATIKTQPPQITWAFNIAWTDLQTKAGAKVSFDLKSEKLPNDAFGEESLGVMFSDLNCSATAEPQGLTESEILAGLQLQSKLRGDSVAGGALDIVTPYYTFSIADTVLGKAPQQFASNEQRAGTLEWKSQKSFTAGALDPVFELSAN